MWLRTKVATCCAVVDEQLDLALKLAARER